MSTKHKTEILSLPNTPPTRCRMEVKSLERLIGNLWSMNLEVPGAIGHFYAMQLALTRAVNRATAYLLELLNLGMHFCIEICEDMDIRPIYLA